MVLRTDKQDWNLTNVKTLESNVTYQHKSPKNKKNFCCVEAKKKKGWCHLSSEAAYSGNINSLYKIVGEI